MFLHFSILFFMCNLKVLVWISCKERTIFEISLIFLKSSQNSHFHLIFSYSSKHTLNLQPNSYSFSLNHTPYVFVPMILFMLFFFCLECPPLKHLPFKILCILQSIFHSLAFQWCLLSVISSLFLLFFNWDIFDI